MGLNSEKDIIEGCTRQDRAYQEILYRHYYGQFLKLCARYSKSMEDAEQLVNDGFLRIFRNIDTYKNSGPFEGWMRRIFVNTCLDYLKSKQMKQESQVDYKEQIPEQGVLEISPDAIRQISFKELLTLIQTLPPMSKTVFNLHVFEGYSHKEIGALLEISEGTSSWHLHQARHQLQQKIKKLNEVEPVYASKRV